MKTVPFFPPSLPSLPQKPSKKKLVINQTSLSTSSLCSSTQNFLLKLKLKLPHFPLKIEKLKTGHSQFAQI